MTTPIDTAKLHKLLRDEDELGAVTERLSEENAMDFPSSSALDGYEDAVMASDNARELLEEAAVEALPALLDENDQLRAEVARLNKMLDVCSAAHAHNVTLVAERDQLRADVARLRESVCRDVRPARAADGDDSECQDEPSGGLPDP